MTQSLEGLLTKAKEAPSPHEVRLAPLDTNPVFQCLEVNGFKVKVETYLKSSRTSVMEIFCEKPTDNFRKKSCTI